MKWQTLLWHLNLKAFIINACMNCHFNKYSTKINNTIYETSAKIQRIKFKWTKAKKKKNNREKHLKFFPWQLIIRYFTSTMFILRHTHIHKSCDRIFSWILSNDMTETATEWWRKWKREWECAAIVVCVLSK